MISDLPVTFDEHLRLLLEIMAGEGVQGAASGLSGMVGETVTVSQPTARLVPLAEISGLMGGPENEAVGIYLQAQGDMAGQIMLILPIAKALELVDLLMNEPPGTARQLGTLERSALAEVGNLTASFFLNKVAALTGLEARPSPPAVMVDMVGAIIDIVVASCGGLGEHVLMLDAAFLRGGKEVQANLWIIPAPSALEAFARRGGRNGH